MPPEQQVAPPKEEEGVFLPDIARQLLKQMDEKVLEKNIFRPLHHIKADPTTGYNKYFNEFFGAVQGAKLHDHQCGMQPVNIKALAEMGTGNSHLKNLGGGNVDIIDKMRFLSKKELAKYRSLKKNADLDSYNNIDMKNENEIMMEDIASDEDDVTKAQPGDIKFQSDDEEGMGADDLFEFWQESEK